MLNVLIGVDQLFNAVFLGDPDETISSRIGKIKVRFGGKIPRRKFLTRVIDWGLEKIDPGHSVDSIEPDEGSDAIHRK